MGRIQLLALVVFALSLAACGEQAGSQEVSTPDAFPSSVTPMPPTQAPQGDGECDPSYPDVCIPKSPPDLDCGDITYRRFRVLPPDPHRFDGDKDGIGCES